MTTIELKTKIEKLPNNPGVYLFKDNKGKILYIGKALNLKSRVKSYLKTPDVRLEKMVSEASELDFEETDSDIEALILESQFIKKHRPAFNIVLRDDKQYSFVVFTEDKYPKIFVTHQPQSHEETIGPFTDAGALKTTLRLLRRIFPFCTCKQLHNNYCLNYHIEKCLGFCCLKKPSANPKQLAVYKKNVGAIKDVLSGKKESLIRTFEKEMRVLSDAEEYEKAMELQNRIEKLKRIFDNARIIQRHIAVNNEKILEELKNILKLSSIPIRIEAYDIANIQGKYAVGAMIAFVNGKPDRNEYRKFKIYTKQTPNLPDRQAGDTAMLREILIRRFKHFEWQYPDLVLIDGGKGQFNAARAVIDPKIPIIALTKNEKHIGHKILIDRKKEVSLSKLSLQLKNLLIQIDSEAHRFAISYYRKIHRGSVN